MRVFNEDLVELFANDDLTNFLFFLLELHLLEIDRVGKVSYHQDDHLLAVNEHLGLTNADYTA